MNNNGKKILIFISILFTAFTVKAQFSPTCSVAGVQSKKGNLDFSYTIGQWYSSPANSKFITPGFQQPPYTPKNIKTTSNLEISIQAYPNPVSNTLHVVVKSNEKYPQSSIQLFNIMGQLQELKTENIHKAYREEFKLDMRHLSAGQYFIRIVNKNHSKSNSIKVIKQN